MELTTDQKRVFAEEFIRSVSATILGNLEKLPHRWGVWEMRRYIGDKFHEASHNADLRRERAFEDDVRTRNL